MNVAIEMMERGLLPFWAVRLGVRGVCRERLREEAKRGTASSRLPSFIEEISQGPIAPVPHKANEQHYEVPPAFFELALGPHLKYSSCYFEKPTSSLEEAERAMLALTCERAELRDGMEILELGCGWGSLTLFMARAYPNARIRALTNSRFQRDFIMNRARERKLTNVEITVCDINQFDTTERFNRVVSVEMFEHMRNYDALFGKIHSWLTPGGKLFCHIFCHSQYAYPYETEGSLNWMGQYFFTGGMMPSFDLLTHFNRKISIEQRWQVSGIHYSLTAKAWRENLEHRRQEALMILADAYGSTNAARWFQRWRVFFLACEELFGFKNGSEWFVGHYRFTRNEDSVGSSIAQ